MVLSGLTKPEIDDLKALCNFTKDEVVLFNLRTKGIPLETCAEMMNLSVSSIKRISQHIGWKIERVLKVKGE